LKYSSSTIKNKLEDLFSGKYSSRKNSQSIINIKSLSNMEYNNYDSDNLIDSDNSKKIII